MNAPRYSLAAEDITALVEDVFPHLELFLRKQNDRLLVKYNCQPKTPWFWGNSSREYVQLMGALAGCVGGPDLPAGVRSGLEETLLAAFRTGLEVSCQDREP